LTLTIVASPYLKKKRKVIILDKNKILIEWNQWELGIKAKHLNPQVILPNMCELMDKIKKGEIKV